MKVRLILRSSKHSAGADSLTMREWESLARLLGELEAEGVEVELEPAPAELTTGSVYETLATLTERVRERIISKLVLAGLSASEWVVACRPSTIELAHVARAWAWGVEWVVCIQLLPEVSAAKRAARETSHAPTLSEQYGRAKS